MNRSQPPVDEYVQGILAGDRRVLGRAITLVESTRADHQALARRLIEQCLPHAGGAFRIGVTGPPGAGKSAFIDALGVRFLEAGRRVAVLAIDPSSHKSKGSILGDKTRMERLASHPGAFVRPSPTGGALGGIALKTREAITLCEAAGYTSVFVETVGVGQSEFGVHGMVDMLILLLITGAGDELQGIKRGIMEMADLMVVNKADEGNEKKALQLERLLLQLMPAMSSPRPCWEVPVLSVSSRNGAGLDDVSASIEAFQHTLIASGYLEQNRRNQALDWMRHAIDAALQDRFERHRGVQQARPALEAAVQTGKLSAVAATETLLRIFESEPENSPNTG